jgi:hypothetical protein
MLFSVNSWIRAGVLLALIALIPACNGSLQNGNGTPSSSGSGPSFGGATAASAGSGSGEVNLTWSPALELSGGTITYFVFASLSGTGTEDMSNPVASTTNSTGVTVSNLTSHDEYWFIVQAQDSAGNVDGNVNEVTATPP